MNKVILITGPARSGKSEWSETLAKSSKKPVIYIATSSQSIDDQEWNLRIQQHQQRRPPEWETREEPFFLTQALTQIPANACVLIDSLGTWVANLLETDEQEWNSTVAELLETITLVAAEIIFVAEETGWGVVPAYASGRLFRDRLGNLTRRIAAIADEVYLVTAGYALNLKKLGEGIGSRGCREIN